MATSETKKKSVLTQVAIVDWSLDSHDMPHTELRNQDNQQSHLLRVHAHLVSQRLRSDSDNSLEMRLRLGGTQIVVLVAVQELKFYTNQGHKRALSDCQ